MSQRNDPKELKEAIVVLSVLIIGGVAGDYGGGWLVMALAATYGSVLCFTWLVQDDT